MLCSVHSFRVSYCPFSVSNLEVDEALLTGEAMPVAKIIEPLESGTTKFALSDIKKPEVSRYSTVETDDGTLQHNAEAYDQIAVGDRINMAFASTIVTRGRGSGVVVATGMITQVGRIAESMQKKKKQRKVDAEGKRLPIWKRVYEGIATFLWV